ncbi:lytic transglycosylase domain-containing protein [Geobacter sp. SVR]|uniref:lytic transglycosylase domain-containing protein n=1 Tax=Geobacter sp. SVR TaxID=2495594 RepID=UPI00143EFD27|nr:lytic transglycosylase domain-containing protein [Geobacter sp. SVR]BCS54912.1 lytic transglycosylase [Geobacter sp. SVR]GCF86109.1 lytic transglycosylase [Geobacter sp. SVR]
MTIGISEKPSLLAPLLAQELKEQSPPLSPGQSSDMFAGTLDTILAAAHGEKPVTPDAAMALAESLNLRMLRTTLSLAGDAPAESPLQPAIGGPTASMLALARTYGANQQEPLSSPASPAVPRQPLPDADTSPSPSAASVSTGGPGWLDDVITKASSQYGVDAGLIKAVIKAESNFNPTAVSHAGARGLMQLMPATARSLGVSDSFDPEQNVMAGTRFLRDLLKRYNGNLDSSLAAYNWGPGNVDKRPDRLPRETQEYLARVKQLYTSYSA